MTAVYTLVIYVFLLQGSGALHEKMLSGVIHTPISFFEANPIGRILNRFGGDMVIVDERIPFLFAYTMYFVLAALATAVLTSIANWLMIFVLLVFAAYAIYIVPLYLHSSLSLIRLERTTRSSIFELFTAIFCAEGLAIIRLHAKQQQVMETATDLIDVNFRMMVIFASAFAFMSFLLDLLSPVLIIIFAVSSMANGNANLLGVTFMYM